MESALEIKKIKLVYFSPTGTTRKIVESIAQGLEGGGVWLTVTESTSAA
jgi:flavodoxin